MAGVATHMSGFDPPRSRGHYTIRLELPRFRFLDGEYKLVGYAADEKGLHIYHSNSMSERFLVIQEGKFMGVVLPEHRWEAQRRRSSPSPTPATAADSHDGD